MTATDILFKISRVLPQDKAEAAEIIISGKPVTPGGLCDKALTETEKVLLWFINDLNAKNETLIKELYAYRSQADKKKETRLRVYNKLQKEIPDDKSLLFRVIKRLLSQSDARGNFFDAYSGMTEKDKEYHEKKRLFKNIFIVFFTDNVVNAYFKSGYTSFAKFGGDAFQARLLKKAFIILNSETYIAMLADCEAERDIIQEAFTIALNALSD